MRWIGSTSTQLNLVGLWCKDLNIAKKNGTYLSSIIAFCLSYTLEMALSHLSCSISPGAARRTVDFDLPHFSLVRSMYGTSESTSSRGCGVGELTGPLAYAYDAEAADAFLVGVACCDFFPWVGGFHGTLAEPENGSTTRAGRGVTSGSSSPFTGSTWSAIPS